MSRPGKKRLVRLPDWEARFNLWLERVRDLAHDYGTHDCMLLCAGDIQALTGKDLARGHRGRYRTVRGAARHLHRNGFRSPEAWIDSLFEEKPIAFAQRGDLVVCEGIPGVCVGHVAVFVSAEGGRFAEEPRERWDRAWRVGG